MTFLLRSENISCYARFVMLVLITGGLSTSVMPEKGLVLHSLGHAFRATRVHDFLAASARSQLQGVELSMPKCFDDLRLLKDRASESRGQEGEIQLAQSCLVAMTVVHLKDHLTVLPQQGLDSSSKFRKSTMDRVSCKV